MIASFLKNKEEIKIFEAALDLNISKIIFIEPDYLALNGDKVTESKVIEVFSNTLQVMKVFCGKKIGCENLGTYFRIVSSFF